MQFNYLTGFNKNSIAIPVDIFNLDQEFSLIRAKQFDEDFYGQICWGFLSLTMKWISTVLPQQHQYCGTSAEYKSTLDV